MPKGGRASVKTPEFVTALSDGVPGPIVRFQMHFGDARDIGQHLSTDLINHLLDAAGFEADKDVAYDAPHAGCDCAGAETG